MKTNQQKAVFFDRDGVINVDHGYVSKKENFEFMDDVFPVMRTFAEKGYALIVVTNQSGIGRGYYTEEDFQTLTSWMLSRFADEGIKITAVYHCPHSPEADCACRKPEPGMLLQAIADHEVDAQRSWMVGDKDSDMGAAEAAGICNRVLLGDAVSGHSARRITKISDLLSLPI